MFHRLKITISHFLILLSVAELVIVILSGLYFGVIPTILVLAVVTLIGIVLVIREGLSSYRNLIEHIRSGEPPGHAILDGVCVLLGGFFFIFPGFLGDILGLLLLIPATRKKFHDWLYHWLREKAYSIRTPRWPFL